VTLPTILRGLGIGLAIAIPVGPVGLLCIRRTLRDGMAMGLATGLGAATADACYGLVVAFGLGAIQQRLLDTAAPLRLIGGVLLLWLAYAPLRSAWRGTVATSAAEIGTKHLAAAYASTVALTLSNPMTILSFIAVIAALATPAGGTGGGLALVSGVFLGSALWWLILSASVAALRHSLPNSVLHGLELVSGLALIGFGLFALFGA
jgi:threonine/homoserine/homoserine lactone efflux protein